MSFGNATKQSVLVFSVKFYSPKKKSQTTRTSELENKSDRAYLPLILREIPKCECVSERDRRIKREREKGLYERQILKFWIKRSWRVCFAQDLEWKKKESEREIGEKARNEIQKVPLLKKNPKN